jgi:uncharacterized membrane protein YhaH (DUF805 family)
LANYAGFAGRASRSEYWWFYLFVVGGDFALQILDTATDSGLVGALWGLFSFAMLLPSLAVGARRLHDIGRTGWWQLLIFTGIGVFVLIYWWAQPTEPKANEYGPPAV